jgi:pimeloyl-ACP methyl ester carboxylesterase
MKVEPNLAMSYSSAIKSKTILVGKGHDASVATTQLDLCVASIQNKIPVTYRGGHLEPVLFLHGFGGSKEDYVDFTFHEAFEGRPFIAYDPPGCGEGMCEDLSGISIPFLVDVAEGVLDMFGVERFHLVGHSMGGLTALLLARKQPERVLSIVNIKGNLGPEDCFLSRQILDYSEDNPDIFLDRFIERARASPHYSSSLFAAGIRAKVRAGAVRGIFESMVPLSDRTDLLGMFLSLPVPKLFMYGNQYSSLTYLPILEKNGVELAELPQCGHFPMYSNPAEMWKRIAPVCGAIDVSEETFV